MSGETLWTNVAKTKFKSWDSGFKSGKNFKFKIYFKENSSRTNRKFSQGLLTEGLGTFKEKVFYDQTKKCGFLKWQYFKDLQRKNSGFF